MADEAGRVFFTVGADTDEVDRAIKDSFGDLLKSAALVTAGFIAVKEAVGLASDVLRESVRAASQADKATVDLAAALARAGIEGAKAAATEFGTFAEETQRMTGVSDDAIVSAAKLGASYGITGDALRRATMAAVDMSAVTGKDLNSTMLQIANSAQSGQASIRGLHVEFKEGAGQAENLNTILDAVNRNFGGAAATAAQTYAGRVNILTQEWDNTHEALGRAITQNETVNAVLQVAAQQVANLNKFIANNQATIAQWVSKGWGAAVQAAVIFVDALEIAGKAFMAFKVIGNLAVAGLITVFDLLLAGVEGVIGGFGSLASAVHLESVAEALGSAHAAVEDFRAGVRDTRETFLSTAADGIEGINKIGDAAHAARDKIAEIDTQVRETAATIKVEMASAAQGVATSLGMARQAVMDFAGIITPEFQAAGDAITEALKTDQIAAFQKANQDQINLTQQAVSGLGDALAQVFESWIAGEANAAATMKGFAQAALRTAEQVIQTYAAITAAKAASWAGIAGPLAAAAAASIAFGIVRGFISKLPGAAEGGMVTGGVRGRDSVPILAMPGEMILPVDTTRALLSIAGRSSGGRAASGGMVSGRAGLPPIVIERFVAQNPEEITGEQIDRFLIRLSRRAEDLHRAGLFLRSAVVA